MTRELTATRDLATAFLDALRPALKILPSEWAERNLVLPQGSNARPGPLRLTRYQKGIVDSIAEPGVEVVALQLSAQSGKSLAVDCIVTNAMANNPGPCLHVSPTEQKAFAYVRDRLDPLIAASPALRGVVGSGAKGVDSKHAKTFPGGSLNFASSYKPDDLAARPIKVLVCDEIDRFASSAGVEGDPVSLALKRTTTFRDSVTVLASTPTFVGTSRIHKWASRGDCRKFFVACHECGALAPLAKERIVFTPGAPATARLRCDDCGHLANEKERLRMVRAGDWVPTNANAEPGIVSFLANELVSEFSSLETIARAVDAAKTIEQRRVLTNTVWAEPFEATAEVELSPGELQARAERIQSPYSANISFLVCGCDVQVNRIEAMFVGVDKRTNERWILDYAVFAGDTSGPQPWADLDAALGRTFRLESGADLPISATCIDSGFNTTVVAQFVSAQRSKMRRVFATKGVSGFDKPSVREGSRLKGQSHRQLLLGVDNIKLAAQKALALAPGEPGSIRLPDHVQSDMFDQLAAERLEATYVRGFPRYAWVKPASQRNEAFDTLVMCLAAASLVTRPLAPVNAPKKPTVSLAERVANLHRVTNQGVAAHG